jgi:Ni,Fe-hydrogenase I cytochrome b subunit
MYYWHQNQEYNLLGKYNFFNTINKNEISKKSMFLYLLIILVIGLFGDALYDLIKFLLGL